RHQNFRPDSCTANGPQKGLRRIRTPLPTTLASRTGPPSSRVRSAVDMSSSGKGGVGNGAEIE
ncbi:unnamed protein product, partial [Scytosiphon promiscuus]